MNTFDKKVAVVTGASSGIGRETVLDLIKAGYQVHAGARRLDAMRDLESAGAHLHHVDLTNPENIDAFVNEVLKLSGRVDVLINNAGYGAYGATEDIPLSAAREQMEVNLFALARLIKSVLPTMRKQRSGRIINVSSIGGKLWSPLGGWYHASKFNRSRGRESGGHRQADLEGYRLKPAEAPLCGPRARARFPLPPLGLERSRRPPDRVCRARRQLKPDQSDPSPPVLPRGYRQSKRGLFQGFARAR